MSIHVGISQFDKLSHDEMFVKTMIFILTLLHTHRLINVLNKSLYRNILLCL